MIRGRERGGLGLPEGGDGGHQGDQLALPATVRDLVLYDADVPGPGGIQVIAVAGGLDEPFPGGAADLGVQQDGPVGAAAVVAPELRPCARIFRLSPPTLPSTGASARRVPCCMDQPTVSREY
jgi:hypothetical protein